MQQVTHSLDFFVFFLCNDDSEIFILGGCEVVFAFHIDWLKRFVDDECLAFVRR